MALLLETETGRVPGLGHGLGHLSYAFYIAIVCNACMQENFKSAPRTEALHQGRLLLPFRYVNDQFEKQPRNTIGAAFAAKKVRSPSYVSFEFPQSAQLYLLYWFLSTPAFCSTRCVFDAWVGPAGEVTSWCLLFSLHVGRQGAKSSCNTWPLSATYQLRRTTWKMLFSSLVQWVPLTSA